MNRNKKVTMIMPCFNSAPYLDYMLQSIYDQTYDNIELIIAYDDSTDGTLNILKNWKEKFDRRNRKPFNLCYLDGKLSYYQYMSIVYTLVLGYSQQDIAFVMGVDQSVVSKNINSGVKRIQRELKAYQEEE